MAEAMLARPRVRAEMVNFMVLVDWSITVLLVLQSW